MDTPVKITVLAVVMPFCWLVQLWCDLKKTLSSDLTAYFLLSDGRNQSKDGFAPREHAVGAHDCFLDGVVMQLLKVYTPRHPNR